ncbi:hypothetical protein CFC21_064290 [Triticum aestivum]|uniref:Uncharacterized protein n=2 Tax=Triticum aestivum TaxID=4565 RepID=A0A3B6KCR2_WHEAT|nr:hypothetical protein CFC21_064290 [Triticum aestivum]
MASMGFSYAQVHVKQERLRRRISEEASTATMTGKSMTGEDGKENFIGEEEKKAASNTWTAGAGRVHPCASSTAAAAPKGGHR